jgi:hypothetical protein
MSEARIALAPMLASSSMIALTPSRGTSARTATSLGRPVARWSATPAPTSPRWRGRVPPVDSRSRASDTADRTRRPAPERRAGHARPRFPRRRFRVRPALPPNHTAAQRKPPRCADPACGPIRPRRRPRRPRPAAPRSQPPRPAESPEHRFLCRPGLSVPNAETRERFLCRPGGRPTTCGRPGPAGPTTLPARANRRSVDLQIKSGIDLSVSRPPRATIVDTRPPTRHSSPNWNIADLRILR